jgi:hypothetical protein
MRARRKFALSALSRKYGPFTLDSGYRSELQARRRLWDASVKAGRTGFMANGNPIERPANRDDPGSDHCAAPPLMDDPTTRSTAGKRIAALIAAPAQLTTL